MEPTSDNQQLEVKAKKLLHSLDEKPAQPSTPMNKTVLILVILTLAGIASGFGIAKFRQLSFPDKD